MDPEVTTQEAEVTASDSLFADEVEELAELTAEAESQGDDSGDPAPEDDDPTEAKPSGEEQPAGTEQPAAEEQGADQPEAEPEKKPEEGKQPEGYVPTQALREERGKRQDAQRRLEAALLEIEELRRGNTGGDDPFKDFKELSPEEFASLNEEDPQEAASYMYRLNQYRDHKATKDQEAYDLRRVEYANREGAHRAYEEMKRVVPDLETGGEGVEKLVAFAEANGFDDPAMLAMMTNPQARISIPGEDGKLKAFPMAGGALSLVKLLNESVNAHGKFEADKKEAVEAAIKETEARVTAEFTKKLKNPDKPSVSEASTYKPEVGTSKNFEDYSEDEWGKLSKSDRDKILAGG